MIFLKKENLVKKLSGKKEERQMSKSKCTGKLHTVKEMFLIDGRGQNKLCSNIYTVVDYLELRIFRILTRKVC